MPNLDNLMDMIAEQVGRDKTGKTFFTTLDLTYAYGQVQLSEDTAKHCNFQVVGGEATGVYRFVTGFYGLTTMPTEFQRIMDLTLTGLQIHSHSLTTILLSHMEPKKNISKKSLKYSED